MAGKTTLRRTNFDNKVKNGAPRSRGVIKKGDARLKIIQKNRSKLVDARDRLAQMAKKTDARAKILKLRQLRSAGITNVISAAINSESVRPVGSNILLKKDRNGKISLSTNKNKKQSISPVINEAIRKELGLLGNSPRKRSAITSKNRMMQLNNSVNFYNKNARPTNNFTRTLNRTQAYAPPPVIKRTIHNDIIREMPPIPNFPQQRPIIDQNLYSWVRPSNRAPLTLSANSSLDSLRQSVEVTAMNNLLMDSAEDWNYADPSIRSFKMAPMFADDEYDEMELNPPRNMTSAQRLKTGVHARLDTPIISTQSQGIFAQSKPKVVVPVGHRIVVSNLQPTVTQDDIRELFEDIGELLVSRLVRPGTAEVIYKNLKDAQKAVDTYHNRQLDGQPMKCLLVNKRPVNNPTAPAVHSSKNSSVLRASGGITKKNVSTKGASNKLIPDINTIHKVLFHKS